MSDYYDKLNNFIMFKVCNCWYGYNKYFDAHSYKLTTGYNLIVSQSNAMFQLYLKRINNRAKPMEINANGLK